MSKMMKAVAALMLMTAVACATGCTKPDEPNNGGNNNGGGNGGGNNCGTGTYNGYEYVDLGLPSGILWATCNVGADTPESNGDYFAWAETTPKTTYSWSTYKYCNADRYQLTKYCSKSSFGYNGFTDDLTTLLPEDDAATVNWGGNWRMPTLEEWQELLANTTNKWTSQNSVNGRLFTAANGNSLFLPAAGGHWDNEVDVVVSYGNYWSSSLYTIHPDNASDFNFYSSGVQLGDGDCRNYCFSVRPVCSAQ